MKIRVANLQDVERLVAFKLENLFHGDVRDPKNEWLVRIFAIILKSRLVRQISNGTQYFLACHARKVMGYVGYMIENQQAVISDMGARDACLTATCFGELVQGVVSKISQHQCSRIMTWLPREYKDYISVFMNHGFIRSGNNNMDEVELSRLG